MADTTDIIIPESNADIIIEDVAPSPDAVISDLPQDGIENLRRQLAESQASAKAAKDEAERARAIANEESRRRADSDRLARDNYNAATNSNAEAREREYESIVNAHAAVASTLSGLKDQLVKAGTDGDFAKVAELQIEMGKYSAKLERLEEGKSQLEEQRRAEPLKPPVVTARESQDQFNSRAWTQQEYENVMRGYTSTTAAWMRANPRFASDPSFRSQVQSAHSLITAKGVPADSEEYFRKVEELVGVRSADTPMEQARDAASSVNVNKENAVSNAGKPAQSRTSPAAPPSRTVPNADDPGNTGGGNRVQLTAEQRNMAKIMFAGAVDENGKKVDPEVLYARHWRDLKKEGRLFQGGVVI